MSTLEYEAPILNSRRGGHFFFGPSSNTTTGNEEVSTDVLQCDDGGVVSLFIDGWGGVIGAIASVAIGCADCADAAEAAGDEIAGAIGGGGGGGGQDDTPPPPPETPTDYSECPSGLIQDNFITPPGSAIGSPTCWKPDNAPNVRCPPGWSTKDISDTPLPYCVPSSPSSGWTYSECPANTWTDTNLWPANGNVQTNLCILQQGSGQTCPSGWVQKTQMIQKEYCAAVNALPPGAGGPANPAPVATDNTGCPTGTTQDNFITPPGTSMGTPTCWKPDAAPDCPTGYAMKDISDTPLPYCVPSSPSSGWVYSECPANTWTDTNLWPANGNVQTNLCILQQGSGQTCPSGWVQKTQMIQKSTSHLTTQ